MNQTKVEEFAEKIADNLLNDPQKAKWENSDVSWWLAKLASEVNAISRALNESQTVDVEDMAVNAATLALIIAYLQGKKAVKKKRKRRTRAK
ncbi:hypothetical protein E2P64_08880 [Candidatus Bathyarchaeota archaeon]|nr:hypothetical protein E2P64_08880 [Candidatus Bathyarchaeota archaeon]